MPFKNILIDKYFKRLILLVPITAIFIAFLFRFEDSPDNLPLNSQIVHSIFTTAIIWIGCMSIVGLLWKWFPWEKCPVKHLILEILFILVFTNSFSLLIHQIEKKAGYINQEDDIYLNIVITNLITFLITTIHEAIFFYQQWKYNFSKSVRLEKDSIEAKYESLKMQVNPHFLFNSLNSLVTLVDNNEAAIKYIENLSEFLRYTLKSRDRELVLVREEVNLAEKYLQLQKSRFKNNLIVKLDIPESVFHYSVPPLVIQMLIENCIKHNIISRDKPLSIYIYHENNNIVIENNLQKKNTENSTGQGIKNIIDRYKFFTSRTIQINETSRIFIVKIPLLLVEV
jgi:LytS/YehU family sensor histidine kinase